MPVIHIEHPLDQAPEGLLAAVCEAARSILHLPASHAWCFWVPVDRANAFRPDWDVPPEAAGPLVRIRCRNSYTPDQRRALMLGIARVVADRMSVPIDSLFVLIDLVEEGQVMARGAIWEGE